MKKRCPHCGSYDVRKIIYGYPSNELWEEELQGKIKLGGCCIHENIPGYFCDECEKEFSFADNALLIPSISKIEIITDHYGSSSDIIKIYKENNLFFIEYDETFFKYEIELKQWDKIITHLITHYCLLELEDEYYPKDRYVLDGVWSTIKIYSDDKEIKRIYCENEFPPMYESMIRYLKNIKLI